MLASPPLVTRKDVGSGFRRKGKDLTCGTSEREIESPGA